jgi:two-component system response regulator DevR
VVERPKMKRILLIGAHNLFREALAVVLGQEPDLEVMAQAGSLAEARGVLRACDMAVVIDLRMPDGDAAQFVSDLSSRSTPRCEVLALTDSLAGEDHVRAGAAGADEVLPTAASLHQIIDVLKRSGGGT